MNLPNNPDFYIKLVVCAAVVIGAIIIQGITGTIPEWLGIAFSSVIVFVLGLSTQTHRD